MRQYPLLCCAIFFVVGFMLSVNSASAQSPTPNIAFSATASHSGGGGGVYGPANYNDGVITANPTACPSISPTPWGWVSTSGGFGGCFLSGGSWIMYEWPSPEIMGEVTIYHAHHCRRYLNGGDIQYWSGSAWITVANFTFGTTYDQSVTTVSFPPVSTTRLRIANLVTCGIAGNQASNPAFREIEVRNVCTDPDSEVSFSAPAFITQPTPIDISYSVGRTEGEFDATITFNFYTPTGILVHTDQTVVHINANTVTGVFTVQSSSLPPGFYNLEVVFNTMDFCNFMSDIFLNQVVMVLAPGQTICEVWPGDVNNDFIVNYGDQKALNTYIHDAMLRPTWLQGPARYRADAEVDPLTYYAWELQPGVPWFTPEGCYMDSDGNGVINNFDYIAIKLNWLRSHDLNPTKAGNGFNPATFDVSQNYPNPFNPSTTFDYSVPEQSRVTFVVMDMLGREVARVIDSELVETGVHSVSFDGSGLSSGQYLARMVMSGQESGASFTETIHITLSK